MVHPVNERFFRVFEFLRDRGLLNSQREFSQACGFPETHFHAYRTGQRNLNICHLTNLYKAFRVNLTYMVSGKGPIMEEDAQKQAEPALAKALEVEKAKVQLLEREREELLKQIEFYQALLKERIK